jgi:hypothetical protein
MTFEGPIYAVKELSECALNIKNDRDNYIIGTMYEQGNQKNTLLLFLNIWRKGLVAYRIKLDGKNILYPLQNSDGLYY